MCKHSQYAFSAEFHCRVLPIGDFTDKYIIIAEMQIQRTRESFVAEKRLPTVCHIQFRRPERMPCHSSPQPSRGAHCAVEGAATSAASEIRVGRWRSITYDLTQSAHATPLTVMATSMQLQTFIVNSEGYINYPVLGSIHVAGMTVEQLQKMLTEKISATVEDPIVNVRIANFEVVVGGEVRQPKKIRVNRSRYSVLDALGDAGDLTEYGERSNILLVREENGQRAYHRLNLNSSDLLTSPYFYLQQNDYIYVEPNAVRQANSKYNQHNSFKLSVISTIVSASSVLASLIIALVIK